MSTTTTLRIPPGVAGLIGLLALVLLTYGALALISRDRPGPIWSGLSAGWLALAVVGALVWAGLFGLVLVAAVTATLGMIENPAKASLGLGTLLVALLGAPFLIWTTVLRQRATDIQHRMAELSDASHFNDKIAAATAGLAARHQVTRVVKGKDGVETVLTEWTDDLVTRAAAIDRLEGLANERPSEAPRIARMLSIYVRELSRTHPAQNHPRTEWLRRTEGWDGPPQDPQQVLADLGVTAEDVTVEAQTRWAQGLRPVRSDMEKAAQALGRFRRIEGVDQNALTIDLREANLQGFDLANLDFQSADLRGVRLDGARLIGANFGAAMLSGARLVGAGLYGAEMKGAFLRNSWLEGADLRLASLENALMDRARCEEADFRAVRLGVGTIFWDARMKGASFSKVDFSNKDLLTPIQLGSIFADASVALREGVTRPDHWSDQHLDFFAYEKALQAWRATLPP